MSRSFKKSPHNNRFLRKPKGRRAAIIRGSRHKGIPPDPWEDIRLSDESMFIWKYVDRLKQHGYSREKAEKMLIKKFKITYRRAHELTESKWR